MTMKDYVRAARLVQDHILLGDERDEQTVRNEAQILADAFIRLFAPDNFRFNQDTFLVACGLQEKPVKTRKARTPHKKG